MLWELGSPGYPEKYRKQRKDRGVAYKHYKQGELAVAAFVGF